MSIVDATMVCEYQESHSSGNPVSYSSLNAVVLTGRVVYFAMHVAGN